MDENKQDNGMHCVLAFDTDEPAFARGFEAGRLWEALRGTPDEELEGLVHASNTEMVLRMAHACARDTVGEQVDETWTLVRFTVAAT